MGLLHPEPFKVQQLLQLPDRQAMALHKGHRDCRYLCPRINQRGDLLIVYDHLDFIPGSNQPTKRVRVMISGPPFPPSPLCVPPSFIDFSSGWDPCLGLEVLWPHLGSSNRCPPDWGNAYSYDPIPHNDNIETAFVQV